MNLIREKVTEIYSKFKMRFIHSSSHRHDLVSHLLITSYFIDLFFFVFLGGFFLWDSHLWCRKCFWMKNHHRNPKQKTNKSIQGSYLTSQRFYHYSSRCVIWDSYMFGPSQKPDSYRPMKDCTSLLEKIKNDPLVFNFVCGFGHLCSSKFFLL